MAAKARVTKKKKKTAKREKPGSSMKTKSMKTKSTKMKRAQKKFATKTKAIRPKTAAQKTTASFTKAESSDTPAARARQRRSYSDVEAGDLQGLSRAERADSESVDELLEEGNALEAEVVAGVEEAENADEQEVHTHETPEDDVPEEYLEKD